MDNWQERYQERSVSNTWERRFSSTESSEVLGCGKGQLDGISPSAFSDGEMLWADGKPMPHPEYNIDLGIRPEGPPLLTKDINKAVQPSTITASKKIANTQEMEDHYSVAMGFSDDTGWPYPENCLFCQNPEYMAWEHQRAAKNGIDALSQHTTNAIKARHKKGGPRYSCPLCLKKSNDRIRHHLTSDEPYNSNLDK